MGWRTGLQPYFRPRDHVTQYFCSGQTGREAELALLDVWSIGQERYSCDQLTVWCAWNQCMGSIPIPDGYCCLSLAWTHGRCTLATARKIQECLLTFIKIWLNCEKWRGKRRSFLNRAALLFRKIKVKPRIEWEIYTGRHQYRYFKITIWNEWRMKLQNEL